MKNAIMDEHKSIFINGNSFSFTPGETILAVAQRNHIEIPTLCYLKGATPTGACRICVVEVEKARNLLPACSTPAENSMKVQTESPQVIKSRRMTLQLLMASGNHNCAVRGSDGQSWTAFQLNVQQQDQADDLCPVWGDCKLQNLAYRYQVSGKTFPATVNQYPMETVNPFIVRDFSRCILCGRCVQACTEIQVNNAISIGYRGAAGKIIAAGDRPLKDSDCVFCGECVQACPVGALVEKDARYKGRPWENKKIRSTCSYCGVGCQINFHVRDNKVVKISGVKDVPPNYGSLCVKGRFGFDFIHSKDRLETPLIKENEKFREATWDEALDLTARRLREIKGTHGPDSIGVFTSARVTNKDNYAAMKFTRAVLKSNNIDHCARLCHSPTLAGLTAAFGSGAMTNTIEDIEDADVILVTGSDTTENHPVLSAYIKRAVKFKNTRLIVIDPRRIKLTQFADHWLRPNLGTDVAWINGLMHVIISENLHDQKFIDARTRGFDELKAMVEKFTPVYVESITGIPAGHLIEAARLYASANAGSIIYGMGITQHITGTDNVKSLANLAMLCGNLGIPGGGINPLRGQNNMQGACDMGGLPTVFTGYQRVADEAIRKKMKKAWAVSDLPGKAGLTVTQMVPMAHDGDIKALYMIGENPLVSDPDLNHAEKSFAKLDFLVVQDIFMSETAQLADVILPSACFAEKDGTFSNTERRVQRVRKAVEAPGSAKEDWAITAEISKRMGYDMVYENSREIFEEIARVTPSYSGITYDRIDSEGIHWPCPSEEHPGTSILHTRQFSHGKGIFHSIDYIPPAEQTDDQYPLYLTTGRVLYHYHTGTMTPRTDGLNEKVPENFVEISVADADKYDLKNKVSAVKLSKTG